MGDSKTKKGNLYYLYVAIGVLVMFLFGKVVSPWGPVTEMGVTIIGIFLGMLILIISTSTMGWPCLLAMFAVIAFGYKTPNEMFAAFLGSSTIYLMLSFLALGGALRASGAGEILAKAIMTRKFLKGRPVLFTYFLFLTFYICGIFIPPVPGFIFAISVLNSISDVAGYTSDESYYKFSLLGLCVACMTGVYTLPIKSMSVAILKNWNVAIGDPTGEQFNNALYIVSIFIVGFLFLFLYTLAMKYVFKCDFDKMGKIDASKLEGFSKEDMKLNKIQIIYIVFFVIAILYSLVLMIIPKTVSWYKAVNGWGLAGFMLLVIAVLGAIRLDGKNIFSVEKVFKDSTVWGVILAVGALSIIGGGLSSPDLGIRTWISDLIAPLITGLPWPLFVFIIIFFCILITSFGSNMVAGIVVGTIAAPFAVVYASQGINVSAAGAAICLSVHMAYLTPAASTSAPILLGNKGMSTGFLWSKGLSMIVIYLISATVIFSLAGYIF